MAKEKCSKCNERESFAKGLCSRCYGIQWRAAKQAESKSTVLVTTTPAALVVEGEVVQDEPVQQPKLPTSEVHLVARSPEEMKAAQGGLLAWLKDKLTEIEIEVRELNTGLEEARRNNWATNALTRARNRTISLETFYFKVLMAVEAGYVIIPEFPIDVFAIRVTRLNLTAEARMQRDDWGWPMINDEQADRAPAGTGEYRNPSQLVKHYENKKKEGDKKVTERWTHASKWQDQIVFPMIAARPVVMNATAEAMALKVFDQIGICRPVSQGRTVSYGKGDPLILGQILHRRASRIKIVSFIIAWHLNLNDL